MAAITAFSLLLAPNRGLVWAWLRGRRPLTMAEG
jgi:hypothetical protein